jgi:hypothetical protein
MGFVKHWTGYEGTGSKGQTIGERGKVRVQEPEFRSLGSKVDSPSTALSEPEAHAYRAKKLEQREARIGNAKIG